MLAPWKKSYDKPRQHIKKQRHCFVTEVCQIKAMVFIVVMDGCESHVQLFAAPWTATLQASLSITNYQSLLQLISNELVMPSSHLVLCCHLLLLPSIYLSQHHSLFQ